MSEGSMGEEMLGREVEIDGRRGIVVGTKSARLVDLSTKTEHAAVRFKIKPTAGRAFWTTAVRPQAD